MPKIPLTAPEGREEYRDRIAEEAMRILVGHYAVISADRVAREAFDVADAMWRERKTREAKDRSERSTNPKDVENASA